MDDITKGCKSIELKVLMPYWRIWVLWR